MKRHAGNTVAVALALAVHMASPVLAGAGVQEGEPAPDFTKNQLVYPPPATGAPRSLSEFASKVVFLFVVGNT